MNNFQFCLCGCKERVKSKTAKFLPGHNTRGRKRPESERKKISETMKKIMTKEMRKAKAKIWKGRKHTREAKQKMRKAAIIREKLKKEKGFKVSEETKQKISKAGKGRKHTEETKQKISKAKKGKVIISEKQKQQISQTLKKYFKTNSNPFKNKHHTKESKQKMSNALKGKYNGEKASNWQGGIDSKPYAIGWAAWYIEKIRARDSHKCQNPKCKNPHQLLDVHHINYDKQDHDPGNLITLCKRCHGKTQKNRNYWTTYYQEVIKNKNISQINIKIKSRWENVYPT